MPLAHPRCRSSAFSLIELLTVIGVVAVLSTLAVAGVKASRERANVARARADLAALSVALEEFKRYYGDYPQLGEFGQAAATPTGQSTTLINGTGPGVNTAQAKLFNCLTGVYGPKAFTTTDRQNGPNFLPPQLADANKYINGSLTNQFLIPSGTPPTKVEQNVSILDPWGRRYIYYYKNARSPSNWQATGYILYSAGKNVAANGTQTIPINAASGLLLPTQTPEMADNIYASP
ncbi:MAG: prepilin-type N-terminal cleavage/methylation domain-containing protein [Verrucomicrobiota bacterium]